MLHTLAVCHPAGTRQRHPDHGRHDVCRSPVRSSTEELRCSAALDTDQDPDASRPRDHPTHGPEARSGPLSRRRTGRPGDQPTAPVHRLDQRPQHRRSDAPPIGAPQLGIHRPVDEFTSTDLIDDDHLPRRHTATPPGMHREPARRNPPCSTPPAILRPTTTPRPPDRRARLSRPRGYVRSRNGSARLGHAKAPLLFGWEREPPRFAGATASRRLAGHVTRKESRGGPGKGHPVPVSRTPEAPATPPESNAPRRSSAGSSPAPDDPAIPRPCG